MKSMQNLVISVPRLEIHRPPISTAIVCNVIKQAGHPVEALDLNIKFYNFLNDSEKFYDFDNVWAGERPITKNEIQSIEKFISGYKNEIAKYDRVFISVFGSWCHMFTEMVCKFIRKNLSHIEIVLGGQGVLTASIGKNAKHFGHVMKEANLCDAFITGEGEKSIVELLNKNINVPGINNVEYKQLNELDNLPFPDYGFYHLDEYDYLNLEKEVFIVGSRGCVRHCTYCDVARYWPKFRFRSGENIASEMIEHYEKHGISRFYFTDSLINGSIKAFHDMCTQLAKYNDTHKTGFKWGGQFIFRPKKQLPQDHYEIVSRAGGDTFYVGVETGSDKIRWAMDKKFTNEDIEWQLEEFSKYNLHCFWLMLTGYLTETIVDHNETLKMFPRWQKYVADGTITGIDFGPTLKFMSHTPLEKMIDSHQVYFLDVGLDVEDTNNKNINLWESKLNPDLDVFERIRRRVEIDKQAIKYNWPTWRGTSRLRTLKILAQQYKNFLAKVDVPKMVEDEKTGLRWVS